jgi:hypothetical protein
MMIKCTGMFKGEGQGINFQITVGNVGIKTLPFKTSPSSES